MGFVSHPLPPIVDESSQILILGSFPSLKSFEEMFYYAHPKNQFWRLLGDIYGVCVNTKEEKIRLLRNSKIALWDVVAACERVNSSDSNLKNTKPNEIPNLLGRFPNIQKVFFTGRTAERLYKKHFPYLQLETKLLPSPSPAYACVSFEKKLAIWMQIIATK